MVEGIINLTLRPDDQPLSPGPEMSGVGTTNSW